MIAEQPSPHRRSAIRIDQPLDPLSESSFASAEQASPLAESPEHRLLVDEMRRYCKREVTGRSFLISGHRGAGKTTLVADAFREVWRTSPFVARFHVAREPKGLRRTFPVLVLLHGPSLFPGFQMPEAIHEGNQRRDTGQERAAAGADTAPAAGADVRPDAQRREANHREPSPSPGQSKNEPTGDANPKLPGKRAIQVALEQVTLCLHRAIAREVATAYRSRLLTREKLPMADRMELAAQLEAELFEGPSPMRLREFWSRGRFLPHGVLFAPADSDPDDQGMRELVAVSSMCEAYRRISGTFKREERLRDAAEKKLEASLGTSGNATQLAGMVLALLTGGLVGVGLHSAGAQGVQPTVGGILAALGAAAVFKAVSSRAQDRSISRETVFLFDFSIGTLDRALPILIERLLAAGIAPIFVVDELDKVDDLSLRFLGMVHDLKQLVAEQAFFCFITDRIYYEKMRHRSIDQPYPVESTYFTHPLFVSIRPDDFHQYLRKILILPALTAPQLDEELAGAAIPWQPEADAVPDAVDRGQRGSASSEDMLDLKVLPYVLLHRSQLHALDLTRQLAALRDPDGNVALAAGAVCSVYAYRFDVTMQLAIEMLLDEEDFRKRLDREPEFSRLAYDAMYYLSRRWNLAPEAELDLSPTADGQFGKYLVERMGKEHLDWRAGQTRHEPDTERGRASAQPPRQAGVARSTATNVEKTLADDNSSADCAEGVAVSQEDRSFLFGRVCQLADLLADPSFFQTSFDAWQIARDRRGVPRVDVAVIQTLQLDRAPADPLLERQRRRVATYKWRYDPSGRALASASRLRANLPASAVQVPVPALVAGAAAEWRNDLQYLRDFEAVLSNLTP